MGAGFELAEGMKRMLSSHEHCSVGCVVVRALRVLDGSAHALLNGSAPELGAECARAVARWRWCWDCGTPEVDCLAKAGRKCCPDCRHRDSWPSKTLAEEIQP